MARRRIEQAIGCLGTLTAVSAAGGAIYGLRGVPAFPREGGPRSFLQPLMGGVGVAMVTLGVRLRAQTAA